MVFWGLVLAGGLQAVADDWPQWLGPHRDATWREEGIVQSLPEKGPEVLWRAPVAHGYSGPAVAGGRVYLMDYAISEGTLRNDAGALVKLSGAERVRCFDADTGKELWTRAVDRTYEVSYPGGPRCTPTVDGGQVIALGAMGHLTCLGIDGAVQWERDFGSDYGAPVPMWGHSAHPLVHRDLVICMVGGEDSLVVAFDRRTGRERWRSLDADYAGYCPPQVISHGGVEQLIVWHPEGVSSLDPQSGELYWTVGIKPTGGSAIAMPRHLGDRLFVSGFSRIGGMLALSDEAPAARIAWRSGPREGVYPVNSTPYLLDGTIYGVDVDTSALMGVSMETGERLWETTAPTLASEYRERPRPPRYGTAFLVYHPGNGQFWIFGEMGDLVIAELSPEGYREISRSHVLEPTNTSGSRAVLWSHPAFAMKSVFLRNDRELVRLNVAEAEPGSGAAAGGG